ncbi:MAG: hypothetical protein JWR14_5619, partial [Caballeronia sp.]|nr:hypothetical protein [Caballeronia sp.]
MRLRESTLIQRLISIDMTALAAHSPATIGKMIEVLPVESI